MEQPVTPELGRLIPGRVYEIPHPLYGEILETKIRTVCQLKFQRPFPKIKSILASPDDPAVIDYSIGFQIDRINDEIAHWAKISWTWPLGWTVWIPIEWPKEPVILSSSDITVLEALYRDTERRLRTYINGDASEGVDEFIYNLYGGIISEKRIFDEEECILFVEDLPDMEVIDTETGEFALDYGHDEDSISQADRLSYLLEFTDLREFADFRGFANIEIPGGLWRFYYRYLVRYVQTVVRLYARLYIVARAIDKVIDEEPLKPGPQRLNEQALLRTTMAILQAIEQLKSKKENYRMKDVWECAADILRDGCGPDAVRKRLHSAYKDYLGSVPKDYISPKALKKLIEAIRTP